MKSKKWKKAITSVLLFALVLSIICTVSTVGYDITLVYGSNITRCTNKITGLSGAILLQ